MEKYYFTSESVTEGHPDKICDQISDSILDELLRQDPDSRCACEVTVEPNAVHIMGEVTSKAYVDYVAVARKVLAEIGYTNKNLGFTHEADVTCTIHRQSSDIAMGVDSAMDSKFELGAGDQGMMFGYACNETACKMPIPIYLAHKLVQELSRLRKDRVLKYLRPDGKSQVTVEYENGEPKRIDTIVISAQHDPDISRDKLSEDIYRELILKVIPSNLMDVHTKILINPTGRFVLGGPAADTGLTGRKIIVDTYGGYSRHGGGAFSGKDPTKVDRSAAYMARYLAKHIVVAGIAKRCEIQLSYAIGVAEPVSVYVDTFGSGKVADDELGRWIQTHTDLRPGSIIKLLRLATPCYYPTAAYGHFGRDEFPWEQINSELISEMKTICNKD